jgi:hypothetical protein
MGGKDVFPDLPDDQSNVIRTAMVRIMADVARTSQ